MLASQHGGKTRTAGHLPAFWAKGATRPLVPRNASGLLGEKKWKQEVAYAVTQLRKSFIADYVVLGGGLVHRFGRLPEGTERGQKENAFLGGIRLWETRKHSGELRWLVL